MPRDARNADVLLREVLAHDRHERAPGRRSSPRSRSRWRSRRARPRAGRTASRPSRARRNRRRAATCARPFRRRSRGQRARFSPVDRQRAVETPRARRGSPGPPSAASCPQAAEMSRPRFLRTTAVTFRAASRLAGTPRRAPASGARNAEARVLVVRDEVHLGRDAAQRAAASRSRVLVRVVHAAEEHVLEGDAPPLLHREGAARLEELARAGSAGSSA